jgi:hypothetical protein
LNPASGALPRGFLFPLMSKIPYVKFYLGDYIKDTRVLPLNAKGGWVDLILAMWENDPQGELIGCIEDFARIMNCGVDEANLVIQTLKQKKIFDYLELDGCNFKITSRKQKKMLKLSKTRKETGKTGGNPVLVKQKDNQNINNLVKVNPEYEYENEYENNNHIGVGEVIFNIEKYLIENRNQLEVVCMNSGKSENEVLHVLKKYHLSCQEKEFYPKKPLSLIAGLQKWLLNENKFKNGKDSGHFGEKPVPSIQPTGSFRKL